MKTAVSRQPSAAYGRTLNADGSSLAGWWPKIVVEFVPPSATTIVYR